MNYREWLRTATEDDLARTLCEIQGRGGCGGCVGVNYTGSDGTCSGKPGEAVRKWLQAEKEPFAQPTQITRINSNEPLDCISRQEAIDDLRGKDPSQIWDTADIEVWINSLPSAPPEVAKDINVPSNDTISRLAAMDALGTAGLINYAATGSSNGLIHAMNVIKGLPAAQPERMRGKMGRSDRRHMHLEGVRPVWREASVE